MMTALLLLSLVPMLSPDAARADRRRRRCSLFAPALCAACSPLYRPMRCASSSSSCVRLLLYVVRLFSLSVVSLLRTVWYRSSHVAVDESIDREHRSIDEGKGENRNSKETKNIERRCH